MHPHHRVALTRGWGAHGATVNQRGQHLPHLGVAERANHLGKALRCARALDGGAALGERVQEPREQVGELLLAQPGAQPAESLGACRAHLGDRVEQHGAQLRQQLPQIWHDVASLGEQRAHVAGDVRRLALPLRRALAQPAVQYRHDERERRRVNAVFKLAMGERVDGGARLGARLAERGQQRGHKLRDLRVLNDGAHRAERGVGALLDLRMRVGERLRQPRHDLRQCGRELLGSAVRHRAKQLDRRVLRTPLFLVEGIEKRG